MKPPKATGTSSFRPLLALRSIIHPPLPLTDSQSQRLLGLLNTSFREQLAASSAQPAPETNNANPLPVDAYLSGLLSTPVFLSSNDPPKAKSGENAQVRVERFLRQPLEVYHELALQDVPSPDVAWAVLKRHTTNMLSLPQTTKVEDGWAVKAVLEVIKPLRNLSPRAHLEDKKLRQQIIRTLVQGKQAEVAAGILNKPWLLHICPGQSDAKTLLEIRRAIIEEVTKIAEQIQGLNKAASLFLQMFKYWQQNNASDRSTGINRNPFLESGQHLLLQYAHRRDPASSLLRTKIYETCTPWVRSNFAKAKLMLYFEDSPYRLYGIVMHRAHPEKQAGFSTACVELILSLVQHQELDKARNVVSLMRNKLIGQVPGLETAMVDEVEMLLSTSPGVDIVERLTAIVAENTRKFTDGELVILPKFLKFKQELVFA